MKLKLDSEGHAVLQDGKPVYVTDDGKEIAFDAPGTVATISRLNGEAKSHREAKEAAEARLKTFEGIDPSAAREAVDKLSRIDAKKLVEAGDMDAAIKTALAPVQAELDKAKQTAESLSQQLSGEKIGNAFGRSKFVAEKLTPAGADLLRTMFASQIKVEDGNIVGYGPNGQKLYSKARPGELADFDEVVSELVESYPHRDHIMKGIGGGSGAQPNGSKPGGKAISRAEFDRLNPTEQGAKIREGVQVIDA